MLSGGSSSKSINETIKISNEDKVFMKLNVRGNLDKIYFILNSWDER